ncbi:MAG: ribonuclease R [Anaerovoracaceae bacterium]|nr:ribonuclease R [Anaerovoracaceae bacterium]
MKRELQRITGTIEKHQKGFGFIRQEEGADFFVAPDKMAGAMNGDTVEAEVLPPYMTRRSNEARVIKVLERKTAEVVGTFERHKHYGFVVPDDRKIGEDVFIRKDFFRNAQTGDKVLAKITAYPDAARSLEGKITEVIAREGQPGADVLSLIRAYGLFETFPSRVNAEAKARSKEQITEEMITESGRLDLRGKRIFTIDGPSAKDLDDAVSIEILPNGNYLLGVHIADVGHYVTEDGYLDREALKRGTSVYLINRVVPMLPKPLSNGSCSLNPGEDKLTLSCIMEIDGEGKVVDHSIRESVIRSAARLVYDDVSDILEKDDPELTKKYIDIADDLKLMGKLAHILRHRRKQKGSLDFDISEAVITLDENENPVSVELEERRTANRLIEEFMLAANETVAEHFFWLNYPFVYRIHEKPDPEKIMDLKTYLMNFGIRLKGSADNIYPKTLADIIADIEDKPYESVVNRVMLRTMKKACYSTECQGHFGLAFRYYCHFTSPIRRYPDLIIHRIIKESITGRMTEEKLAKYKGDTERAADISSKTERKAQELEREVDKMKKAQFMEGHIGEEFDGIVSGVTDFGVYVELANTIEGMAFASELARPYQLGEKVRIRVMDARPQERQIDFKII